MRLDDSENIKSLLINGPNWWAHHQNFCCVFPRNQLLVPEVPGLNLIYINLAALLSVS